MNILTADDLIIGPSSGYDYYEYGEYEYSDTYEEIYKAKINKMDAEKIISEAKVSLAKNQELKHKSWQIDYENSEIVALSSYTK